MTDSKILIDEVSYFRDFLVTFNFKFSAFRRVLYQQRYALSGHNGAFPFVKPNPSPNPDEI